jgi:hypothetical protein
VLREVRTQLANTLREEGAIDELACITMLLKQFWDRF